MQMFRRGGRSIAVLTAVLVSTLTLAPAFAAKQVTRDTRGDVASLFFDPEAVGLPVPTPVPDETSADITRTVVRHTARRVIVKVHFRDALARRAPAMYLNLTTPDTQFEVNYDKTSIEPLMILKRGRNVACKGAKSAFPLDADIATISLPRRCLGAPRWVRLQVGALRADRAGNLLIDDGQREGMRSDLDLVTGPRVRKG